tara:strand:- start:1697 stop:2452 length:756 start_codon:yes stop_codon:yes gene_type:complete
MIKTNAKRFKSLKIGITGVSGTLGKALTKKLKSHGAYVIGISSQAIKSPDLNQDSPNEWQTWRCGEEALIKETLEKLDILVLNHGVNYQGSQSNLEINKSLEVNAISSWRLIEVFENIAIERNQSANIPEIWVNTSEAEIQPALSPTYEISKRLIGQLVSIKMNEINTNKISYLKIRKLILGPFKSNLNPIGLLNADIVAGKILRLVELNQSLIIVSPNPITYLLMPLTEFTRSIYFNLTKKINSYIKIKP